MKKDQEGQLLVKGFRTDYCQIPYCVPCQPTIDGDQGWQLGVSETYSSDGPLSLYHIRMLLESIGRLRSSIFGSIRDACNLLHGSRVREVDPGRDVGPGHLGGALFLPEGRCSSQFDTSREGALMSGPRCQE